ncbi:MAG TPA: phosphatidate cytidylyltransferase [Candidatus Limnocylindria bacterium]|nr:phosphatidate cytidylyltransferase [Candidatus Limnocylindria bacterium]
MLRTRVITGVVLAPVVLAVILLGEPWVSMLVGVLVFLALVELIALLDAAGFEPPQVLSLAVGVAVAGAILLTVNEAGLGGPLLDLVRATQPLGLPLLSFVIGVVVLAFASFTRADPRGGFVSWATSSFGVAYVALLAPFLVVVAHLGPPGGNASTAVGILDLRSGAAWALLLVAVVWGYDTGAYLTGRWVGRHRLIDHISPSKTIEGMAGGLIVATLAAGIGAWLVGLEPWHPLLIGPLIGLAAQAGDLAESLLKRAAGRKESGFLIPGHGGVLDRVDSFLFAAPALAGYALLVAGRVA